MNNEKLRPYIFAFLVFCVLSSTHIIIYNEETLVCLSFIAFVFFVFHYFGNTIKDSLNEKSKEIQLELQNYLNLKKESLEQLLKEHEKVTQGSKVLNLLQSFTSEKMAYAGKSGEQALNFIISQQIDQKLNTLSLSKLALQQKLQQLMAGNLFYLVLVKIKRLKNKDTKQVIGKNSFPRQISPNLIRNVVALLTKGITSKTK